MGRSPDDWREQPINRLSDRSFPKWEVAWFPYGGLECPVYAERVPEAFIEQFHVFPAQSGSLRLICTARVVLAPTSTTCPPALACAPCPP